MNRFCKAAFRPITTTDWDRAFTTAGDFLCEEDIIVVNIMVAKGNMFFIFGCRLITSGHFK